jgi:hypothetical protein
MLIKKSHVKFYDSSWIECSVYDRAHRRLSVKMKDSSWYCYSDVPSNVVRAFVNADSQGKAFNLFIKDKYAFEKRETMS